MTINTWAVGKRDADKDSDVDQTERRPRDGYRSESSTRAGRLIADPSTARAGGSVAPFDKSSRVPAAAAAAREKRAARETTGSEIDTLVASGHGGKVH